jgi:hypothetical protein
MPWPDPGRIVTTASTAFEGSASGVAVTVTVLGFGTVIGAVYVSTSGIAANPLACVVVVSVPQVDPLHPVPASDHVIVALGFDPETGTSVATRFVLFPAARLLGADSCIVKLLVM